jgi:hypothetical protein
MRRALAAGLVAIAVLVAGQAGASSQAPGAKPFSAYPSCGAKGKHADRFCFQGDKPVAVFRAFGRREVDYKLCFRKAGKRQRCTARTTNNPGQRSRTRFDVDGPGKYKLAWFEGGKAVDRDRLVLRERAVFSVGDSLGEGTRPYLPRALGRWKVDQSVSISRHAPEGVSILRRRGGLPGVIVFALGTNDSPGAVSTFRNAIADAVRIAGATRCVVVPNIVRPPVGGTSYAGYNRVIADFARKQRNFREVDWAGLVSRNRGWLAGDGVHVNATGYQARARAIAKQVERC